MVGTPITDEIVMNLKRRGKPVNNKPRAIVIRNKRKSLKMKPKRVINEGDKNGEYK